MDHAISVLQDKLRDAGAEATNLPLALLESITENFNERRKIGAGAFGAVYKGMLPTDVVAVKKLSSQLIDDKPFKDELFCVIRAKHENVVRLLGYCANNERKIMTHEGNNILVDVQVRLLCFEYIPNGTLVNYLTDEYQGLEWHKRYRIIKGICNGLCYLHEKERIAHLDLKPQNILLDNDMIPKISDFGLSRLFNETKTRTIITSHDWGTRGYMAPEIIDDGIITLKADIYSLGVIILEIMTGRRNQTMAENVQENWKNRLQRTLSHSSESSLEACCQQIKTCVEIALKCRETNIEARPTIREIIDTLAETELETVASTKLLDILPLELRFPFKPKKPIVCPLLLSNNTDHRFAFRLQPGNPEIYFTEWLCGVVPPRSTYILNVTMKEQHQAPLGQDKFLFEQSRVMDADMLKDISQGAAGDEFHDFFMEVEKTDCDRAHQLTTLIAVCDPQGVTTSEVISTVNFDKMVSMDVHPTKPLIVTGHFNGNFCIWNYQTKAMLNSFEVTREQEVLSVKFIAQKQWVVAGGGDHCIHVYNYTTMKIVKKFKALTEQITSLAVHPTEPYLLCASYDFEIKLWDWENGWRSTGKFTGHSGSVLQVAFNAKDAKGFASVSEDMTLKIWSVDSPRSKLTLSGHTSYVRCLEYFTRGNKPYLITGSDDGTAKIWDLQQASCVATLEGHANRVSAVCSHPDLPILMTGSRDGTVRIWNSDSFRLERILNFGLRKVYALGCMKGSRRVAIGHSNGLAITEI